MKSFDLSIYLKSRLVLNCNHPCSSLSGVCFSYNCSLRSKRFRRVREQRKTEKRDFQCFRAGKTPKIPFLGLSLLPNPRQTLATQANTTDISGDLVTLLKIARKSKAVIWNFRNENHLTENFRCQIPMERRISEKKSQKFPLRQSFQGGFLHGKLREKFPLL